MGKRIVVALGGNALGSNLTEQMQAVKQTVKAIADLIAVGNEVVLTHGNGPQVGMINNAMTELHRANPKQSVIPMSVCVAMSQGYIGYDLQSLLRTELLNRNIDKYVTTVITQVRVDEHDQAFANPTKPIGNFMTREEAEEMKRKGYHIIEDSGRGYRVVVASPTPVEIMEIHTVETLLNAGEIVIAAGGGGIPVIRDGNYLKGVGAVIDKDLASSSLASHINADCLIILTAVEKVAIHFGKPNQKWLDRISTEEAKKLIEEGHFADGSMLPKVKAAVEFVESGEGRTALITLLEKAKEGLEGKTGTIIYKGG